MVETCVKISYFGEDRRRSLLKKKFVAKKILCTGSVFSEYGGGIKSNATNDVK